jgi:hypothetical protein
MKRRWEYRKYLQNSVRCTNLDAMPLCIDLYCGLGGWADGFLAEGWDVIGFDTERHIYGEHRYPAQLVLQDVRTLHGRQFRSADMIVGSPPCQAYSYRYMPWSKGKALPPPDNALFDACFRLRADASCAARRRIPLVVENVIGAQKWVGKSRAHFGAFHLWGDIGQVGDRLVIGPAAFSSPLLAVAGRGVKQGGDWFNASQPSMSRRTSSKSKKRKEEVAKISKIPLDLAQWIARCFKP